ncbi:hypothetical protein SKAU_G00326500 [Synaphobranchus kaupii]|uniref:Gypsy retrotransposon integrase-like protein 1 n=1 Tax=Synaphobranchus kaupii TaxID=118154 RepID=A0A9Q1IK30_SYNKA|nr:hypothetical protein SKAU_G00326500 [Synaphobranchus kaupii]
MPAYSPTTESATSSHAGGKSGSRAVIPATLRTRVLHMAHEGHLGVVKVKQRCRDTVWWLHIDLDVEDLVKNCTCCLLSGKTGQPATAPLTPLQWPSPPWEHIQVDLCGELHGAPAHTRYLLVVHDVHSKWPEAFELGSITTHAIITCLDKLFGRWGQPSTVTSDNVLISSSSQSSCHSGPSSTSGQQCTTLRHSTTGVSPALLMIGRELKQPLDCLRAKPAPARVSPGLQRAKVQVRSSQAQMKQRFETSRRVRDPSLSAGDWVRVKHAYRQNKLQSYWSVPQQVTRWHSNRLHRVRAPTDSASSLSPAASLSWQPTPGTEWLGVNPPLPPGPAPQPARPQRERAPPVWFRDYVLSC